MRVCRHGILRQRHLPADRGEEIDRVALLQHLAAGGRGLVPARPLQGLRKTFVLIRTHIIDSPNREPSNVWNYLDPHADWPVDRLPVC